jgi:hypothetical protein
MIDSSAGVLLVPEGIIRPVVSASTLTWFIRYAVEPRCLELACLDISDKSSIFVGPCKVAVDLMHFYLW